MTALDRAFIRAYGQDVPAGDAARKGQVRRPHAPFTASVASAKQPLGAAIAAANAQADQPTILPLSAYATSRRDADAFRPAFEVDRFVWPATCDQVIGAVGDDLTQLVGKLFADELNQPTVLAVTGCRRGEGRTTLLLAIARQMAAAGSRVALADADFASALLARQLGLSVRVGFADALAGDLSLEEVLVESLEDHIVLLPLREPIKTKPGPRDALRLAVAMGILRDRYDVVLVDAGPTEKSGAETFSCLVEGSGVTAGIVICDARNSRENQLGGVKNRLAAAKINCLGVIENFIRGE